MTGWLVEALIASTLLMALVLLVRRPVRDAFGPQVGYALWALPLLRLVLPPLPDAWRQAAVTPISRASETITIFVVDGGSPAVAPGTTLPSIGMAAALLWALGALGFLFWHLASHTRFCRRLLGSAAAIEKVRGVRVIASEAAPGPLAFGVLRRYVAFPIDFADRYDADERELALEHEIGHHQRGDLIANWIALAVLAVHWFNPVAWRAFRAFRADQELANDARVLSGRSAIDRHAYACAIVKAAHGGAVSAACHLHTIDDLKGRIRMLSTSPRSRRRLAAGGVMVATLVLAGLGVTASGTRAAAALTGKVGDTIGVDLQAAPPAPPAPPATPAAVAAPAVPAAPDPPSAPAAPARPAEPESTAIAMDGGKTVKVKIIKAGQGAEGPVAAQAAMTAVSAGDCGDGDARSFVIEKREANRRKITVICTDRITKAAMAGTMTAADAQSIKVKAITAALSGVEASRASIAANRDMAAAERSKALAEMDAALAELRAEMASPDKD